MNKKNSMFLASVSSYIAKKRNELLYFKANYNGIEFNLEFKRHLRNLNVKSKFKGHLIQNDMRCYQLTLNVLQSCSKTTSFRDASIK